MNLSLASCSSAELVFVSIHQCKIQLKKLYLQLVEKDSHLPSEKVEAAFVSLYPNPTSHEAKLKLQLANNSKITVNVFDIQGKNVMSLEKDLEKGEREVILTTSMLKNGEYFVQVNNGTSSTQIKMVVIH